MKRDNKSIIITCIIAGTILLITFLIISNLNFSKNTIVVEGISSVEAQPDLVGIYFNIETKAETSSEAKDLNNEIYNALADKLVIQGFEKTELKTQAFNVYPNYIYRSGQRIQDGFIATHSLQLELSSEEFDKISGVIDAGADSGAGISYINFELSQELQNQYKAEALELASQDAQIKAEAVANGLNKRVGRLVSVSVSEFGYYPWNVYTREGVTAFDYDEAEVAKEAAAIEPGDREINARVSAIFKII